MELAVTKKTVTITRKYNSVTITREDLIKAFGLPDNASISVSVPGGGDWSNCELPIDRHTRALSATWASEDTVETEE